MTQQNLTFPSTSDSLHIVENLIDNVCSKMHLDEDYYGNILIAVTEAVNNAINHGNKQDPTKTVTLEFTEYDDNSIKFRTTNNIAPVKCSVSSLNKRFKKPSEFALSSLKLLSSL